MRLTLPLWLTLLLLAACGQKSGTNVPNGTPNGNGDAGGGAPPNPSLGDEATTGSDDGAAAGATALVIDGLDGEVTQNEIDTFIAYVAAMPVVPSQWDCCNGATTHNYLADGEAGTTLEAINDLYVVTGGIFALEAENARLLDLAISWTDAWLTHRNDLPSGEHRVMWTGNVDPVWPPNAPSSPGATYAESEVGDTVAHMAYTALNILNTPSIWNTATRDGDPNHLGATYLARAKSYLSMLEPTMAYFSKYFIDSNSLTIVRPAASTGYLSTFHNVDAWNVQMMLVGAYQRIGQCHELLKEAPDVAKTYKTIVKNATNALVQNAIASTAPDGTAVFDWGYGNMGDVLGRTRSEDTGHGQYDMWGLTRAFSAGYTDATAAQMRTYADTVVHEISGGPNVYYDSVDRKNPTTTNYLYPAWVFLAAYNPDLFKPFASAAIAGKRQQHSPIMTSCILWAKHQLAHP
jgi:hypothetical protein